MRGGAAPMMTPTLAGSATRGAWIISTLHPASPMTASAASHAHSPPAGRGSSLRQLLPCGAGQRLALKPRPGGEESPGCQVADGLSAEDRVASEQAGGGH